MMTGILIAAATSLAALSPPGVPSGTQKLPEVDPAPAVVASNAFGIELYKHVAADGQDRNIFISPYSMALALTMAAEGARGQTEQEMMATLRIPPVQAGRSVSALHPAHAALVRQLALEAGVTDEKVRDQIAELRRELSKQNRKVDSLSKSGDFHAAQEAHAGAASLAAKLNELQATFERFDLRVANSLWVEQTFEVVPEFLKVIDTWYGAGAASRVDFRNKSEKTRQIINEWVEKQTADRITNLLPPGSITKDTRLVLASAVYFKGEWADPFKEGATTQADFTHADGATSIMRLMRDGSRNAVPYGAFNEDGSEFETPTKVPRDVTLRPACYPDDGGFTMIELPYKGDELRMTVLLPRRAGGIAALEAKLNAETLGGWLGHLTVRGVDTALPRFKMEFEREMSEVLQAMGMKRAYVRTDRADGAEFDGISASADTAMRLFIGLVQHKARVEVTEKGTEAAAATAVALSVGEMAQAVEMVPFTPVFRADHPFLFLIRDAKTGLVLFIGRVASPTPAG